MKKSGTRTWKVKVSFSPFENDSQRDRAYQIWAKLFVQSVAKAAAAERDEAVDDADIHRTDSPKRGAGAIAAKSRIAS